MTNNKQFDYTKRNFQEIRTELVDFVKQYYPTIIQDFSDESLGMMLLELVAGVGDILNQNLDNAFNETQLQSAHLLSSVLNIAKNLGVNVGNVKASATILDIFVRVPVKGDSYNRAYAPIIRQGMRVSGGGQEFETITETDFTSPFNSQGIPNLRIIPIFNENQVLISYDLVKREIVLAGKTKIDRRYITINDVKPFMEITLAETDVINIEGIITQVGNVTDIPTISQFLDEDIQWTEVEYLAQQYVTVVDNNTSNNKEQYKQNKNKKVTRKFIKEFDQNGNCKLIFGSGSDENKLDEVFSGTSMKNALLSYIDNYALGEIPKANTTMFIRYRVGGGANSTANARAITTVTSTDFLITGDNASVNTQVRQSLRVSNPIPALGGGDRLGIEAVRNLATYNYSSQNRAVTLTDYNSLVINMPGEFGAPFKTTCYLDNNKVIVSILGLDSDGKLSNTSNSMLRNNISNYLSQKRMINDYVEIADGRIYNLAFEYEILITDSVRNPNEMATSIINTVKDFFDVNKLEMNTDVYIDDINVKIKENKGVIAIINQTIFNKVGGKYSNNRSSIPLLIPNDENGQLQVFNNILHSDKDSMFEIKYPNKDIKIIFKRRRDVTIS